MLQESEYAFKWAVQHLHKTGVHAVSVTFVAFLWNACFSGRQPCTHTHTHVTPVLSLCCLHAGDTFKLIHCIPSLPPGRLVAVPGAGLLRVPRVDPALLAEKAAAEADGSLARKFKGHMQGSGVSWLSCGVLFHTHSLQLGRGGT